MASATSLLALLLLEGREVRAAAVLSDAATTVTFSQTGGTAGDVLVGTSVSKTNTATVTGGSGTTLSFAATSGQFGPTTIQSFSGIAINTAVNKTGTFTFTPTTTGVASTTVKVTDTGSGANTLTLTLTGTGVAPLESISAPSIYALVGQATQVSETVFNTGNGNLSGQGTLSNLRGTFGNGNSVFVGTGTTFSLGDPTQTVNPTSSSFAYTFTPTITGAASTTVVTTFANGTNASNAGGSVTTTLSAMGVAPIAAVTNQTVVARVGSTVSNIMTVGNTGNANLAGTGTAYNLNGSVSSSSLGANFGTASGFNGSISLASNAVGIGVSTATSTLAYTYAPVSRGVSSTSTVSVSFSNGSTDGKNLSASVVSTLTATGVGPVYTSSISTGTVANTPTAVANGATGTASSTISVGTVAYGKSNTVFLNLWNTSTDVGGSLTNLTIERYSISGANASSFSIGTFTANSIITEGGELILPITVTSSSGAGPLTSTLTIFTDESTGLGGVGDTFTYLLSARSIPEPTSLAVLGAGLAGLASFRRRRKA